MNKEEYQARAAEEGDWAPGWDAIEEAFVELYPQQEPHHYGTEMAARAIFGGSQYLDGYSIYASNQGYQHIVTFGLSELYTNDEAFGGEFSKWGYELTIKLPASSDEEAMWALDMLANLARYTFTSGRWFEPLQFVSGNNQPIKVGADTALTAFLIVEDPGLASKETLHGKVQFLQVVGITEVELQALITDKDQAKELVAQMKQDNPALITDLQRTKNYL